MGEWSVLLFNTTALVQKAVPVLFLKTYKDKIRLGLFLFRGELGFFVIFHNYFAIS